MRSMIDGAAQSLFLRKRTLTASLLVNSTPGAIKNPSEIEMQLRSCRLSRDALQGSFDRVWRIGQLAGMLEEGLHRW